MLNNASPLEMAYTAIMLIALGASLANWLWAHARLTELKQRGENGIVEALRRGARADQLKLVGVCLFLAVIGINALFAPANPRAATVTSLISGVAFIALSGIVFWLSINIRRRPARLRTAAGAPYKDVGK